MRRTNGQEARRTLRQGVSVRPPSGGRSRQYASGLLLALLIAGGASAGPAATGGDAERTTEWLSRLNHAKLQSVMAATETTPPEGLFDCLCSGRWHAGHVAVRFDPVKGACQFSGLGTWHEGLPGDPQAWGQCIFERRYPSGKTLGDLLAEAVNKHWQNSKGKPRPSAPPAGCDAVDESFIDHYDGETPEEAASTATQLAQLQIALEAHVRRLAKDGYYIANKTEVQKVLNTFWHLGAKGVAGAANTVSCVLNAMPQRARDRPGTEAISHAAAPKAPAPEIELDKGWTQCQEAVDLARGGLEHQIRGILGEDALISTIAISHAGIESFNHIANLVVLPNGQRFVIDLWSSLSEGLPRIYREDKWLQKWRCDTWVGGAGAAATAVTYGAMASGDSALFGALERHRRGADNFDFGSFSSEQRQKDRNRAGTLIRSVQKFPIRMQHLPLSGASDARPAPATNGPGTKPGWSRARD